MLELTLMQKEHREHVRAFVEKYVRPMAERTDEEERFPAEAVDKMSELGLMGTAVPINCGGMGLGEVNYAVTVEEISKACASTGVILSTHHSLVAAPILAYGTQMQKERFLTPLASGKKLGAFALTEPDAGSDIAAITTTAVRVGESWILDGQKCFITNGGVADYTIVFAKTQEESGDSGISAFVLDKGVPGYTVERVYRKMGIRGSVTAVLRFDNCLIPDENRLGKVGQGREIALRTLDGGRIGIAAQALGIAQGALDATRTHLNNRRQFSKPLAAFQGLRFEIAEMATRVEAARGLVYKAAWLKETGRAYTVEAAMAKLFASETAMYVTTKAVQLHGGIGYLRGTPVERMMRDAKVTEIYEGTSEIQKVIIAGHALRNM